jgi:hypothetical protein
MTTIAAGTPADTERQNLEDYAEQLELLKAEILAGHIDVACEWIDAAVKILRREI